MTLPWILQFKPQKLDDIILNSIIKNKFNDLIKNKKLKNIILSGIHGCGKTLLVSCLAKSLYGNKIDNGMLVINGSDERGIKIVDSTISNFCKKKSDIGKNKHKLILVDEADKISSKTHQLINTFMETYKHNTKFIFTCNNTTGIIEGIQSKCIQINMPKIPEEDTINKLIEICSIVKIKYDSETLRSIYIICQGDLRKAINILQLVFVSYGEIINNNVYEIIDKPHPETMKELILTANNKDLTSCIKQINDLIKKGFSPSDIILGMFYTIRYFITNEMSEERKIKFLNSISQEAIVICRGISSDMQLVASICDLIDID